LNIEDPIKNGMTSEELIEGIEEIRKIKHT